ncbi:MAG TPA: winged helix DNA-binding domain-containing protein [Burkholderiaceae bacterium]|nr:winged helix DNA-binding domain-containing protein [Burkholderiaceae bacterium]
MPSRAAASIPTLSARALNRATLQRQWLLQRRAATIVKALEHLVGLQAQAPNPPYLALWARLAGFSFGALTALIVQRRIVRCALMRSTLHLVSAADLLVLRPVLQPVLERGLRHSAHARHLNGLDLQELAAAAHDRLAHEPVATGELGIWLAQTYRGRDPTALAVAARCQLPLVHVPPAGTWGSHKNAALCPADVWLAGAAARAKPAPADHDPLAQLVCRYLAAFGPASAADIATWCGLTQLKPVLDRLAPTLRRYRSDDGRTLLYDLARTRLPDPDTPAPARLLPGFDNLLLSHADRRRVLADADRARVFGVNGLIKPVVLVDGFVRATWQVEREKDRVVATVEPFVKLSAAQRDEIAAEAESLMQAVEPDAAARHVCFARVGTPMR